MIESLTTESRTVRHIMNLETAVSVVAGYFYMRFAAMAQRPGFSPGDVMPYRYLDWAITTPMLLLAMLLFVSDRPVAWRTYAPVLLLDLAMLGAGYAGESGRLPRAGAGALSFAFFAGLLAALWAALGGTLRARATSARAGTSAVKGVVFGVFAVSWTLYGVAYYVRDERWRAIAYNGLDVVSKALVGLFLWATAGRVLV